MFATQRKTALIAPVAVIATLAYFRRRELLMLAPFGLVIGVMVAAVSPSAVHNVVAQFTRSDAGSVATTSERAADYDAIRPDLFTHLVFGRGFGSYNHASYRILDSEILSRTIETGILGLAAFLLIPISVILVARKTVSQRDPRWAPAALCGVSAAVCMLVLATLYDVMAVPHVPCVFLYLAGLAVAVVGLGSEAAPPPPATRAHGPGAQAPAAPRPRRQGTGPHRLTRKSASLASVGLKTMGIGIRLRKLWRLKLGLVISIALALFAGLWSVQKISLVAARADARARSRWRPPRRTCSWIRRPRRWSTCARTPTASTASGTAPSCSAT